jgi:hypothetical protein
MACLRAEKGAGSSHRPALAFFGSEPHLAWKGVSDDVGSYWSRRIGTSWQPQQNIPAVGTSNSPALVEFNDRLFLFWKGMRDDPNVYFSSLSASDQTWAPNVSSPTESSPARGRAPCASVPAVALQPPR